MTSTAEMYVLTFWRLVQDTGAALLVSSWACKWHMAFPLCVCTSLVSLCVSTVLMEFQSLTGLKSSCWQDCIPSGGSRGEFFLAFSRFQRLPAFLGSRPLPPPSELTVADPAFLTLTLLQWAHLLSLNPSVEGLFMLS